jgi:hypothetical protein
VVWALVGLETGLVPACKDARAADDCVGLPQTDWAEEAVQGVATWGRINPDFARSPTVSFSADLVVLQRSSPTPLPILWDGNWAAPMLDASDLGTAWSSGGRFNLTFLDECGWDFMLEGLVLGDFTSQRSVDTSGGVNLLFYWAEALEPVDTVYSRSDLDSVEFNVRRRLGPHVAVLAGLRYLTLEEEVNFATLATPNSGYFSQTDNQLFGIQGGFEVVLPARGLGRLFASGKFGVFNNRYHVAAQCLDEDGAPVDLGVRDGLGAFVGEFNVGFEVQTVPWCTLRFGYQALWIDGVALSVDQLYEYDAFAGTGSLLKGNPVYQGVFAGLVWTF